MHTSRKRHRWQHTVHVWMSPCKEGQLEELAQDWTAVRIARHWRWSLWTPRAICIFPERPVLWGPPPWGESHPGSCCSSAEPRGCWDSRTYSATRDCHIVDLQEQPVIILPITHVHNTKELFWFSCSHSRTYAWLWDRRLPFLAFPSLELLFTRRDNAPTGKKRISRSDHFHRRTRWIAHIYESINPGTLFSSPILLWFFPIQRIWARIASSGGRACSLILCCQCRNHFYSQSYHKASLKY